MRLVRGSSFLAHISFLLLLFFSCVFLPRFLDDAEWFPVFVFVRWSDLLRARCRRFVFAFFFLLSVLRDAVQAVSSLFPLSRFSRGGACCLFVRSSVVLRSSCRCCCCCPSPCAVGCSGLCRCRSCCLFVRSPRQDHGKDHGQNYREIMTGQGCGADCFLVSVPAFRSRGADRVQLGRRATKQKSAFLPVGPSVVPFVVFSLPDGDVLSAS